jgi:hypothetical protein
LFCLLSKIELYVSDEELGSTLRQLIDNALKSNTKRTYSSAQQRYLKFCVLYEIEPLPATEEGLLYYISFLFKEKLKGSTIRVYLAAVRNLHIMNGLVFSAYTPKILMAIKGAFVLSDPPTRMKPITFGLLSKLLRLLPGRFDEAMLSVAFTLGFFGCLRSGEFCLPDRAVFDPKIHLCLGDVSIIPGEKMFSIFLKSSKTDVLSSGVSIYVGCSKQAVCAFCLMSRYISKRDLSDLSEPLLVDPVGNILRRAYFVSTLKLLVSLLGYSPTDFSGHSLRAGAATSGANQGLDGWELKMLGRWRSDAYNVYLRDPKIVSTFAVRLACDD